MTEYYSYRNGSIGLILEAFHAGYRVEMKLIIIALMLTMIKSESFILAVRLPR